MGLWERLLAPFRDDDAGGEAFDRVYGTETRWYDLANYEPTPPTVVEEVLDALPVPPGGLTFVDLGSGKGRAVLLASRRPFRAAVGIEHRPALHAVAERNRERFAPHARCPVHLFVGDAAEHPLPDGPLLVWLFNPFGPAVLGAALAHLPAAHPHWLAYAVPRELPRVRAAGFAPVAEGGPGDCPWVLLHRPALTP